MNATPVIILEQRSNTLYIHCPTVLALDGMKRFLTFIRPVKVKSGGRYVTEPRSEPCFKVNDNPFILECSAGFLSMIVGAFNDRYDFKIMRSMSRRVRENTEPDWSQRDSSVAFRARQREAIERMIGSDRGRIIVPTAFGKSFLICQYAKIMTKARILITTYANSVLLQIYEELAGALPGQVGIRCSAKKQRPDARIVCVSQGTLQAYCGAEQNIDVLLCDEVHEWGSPSRIELLRSVKEAKMFAFSANESRPDGAEFLINGIFGPVLLKMDYDEAVDLDLVTPICVVWVPVRSERDPAAYYADPTARERHGVWRYRQRNLAIVKAARLFPPEDQVLIPVKTLDHALHLKRLLPEFTVVYAPQDVNSITMRRFTALGLTQGLPPMTPDRLNMLRHRFSTGSLTKVIATTVWSRGVNFPGLSVVIRADGTNSCIADTQWPGRAARKQDGKTVSLLFDFTDEYNPGFRFKASERKKRYGKNKWTQMTWNDLQTLLAR